MTKAYDNSILARNINVSGVHSGGGVSFRLNYAGIGYVFREDINSPEGAFVPPCLCDEYVLDETTGLWEIPS